MVYIYPAVFEHEKEGNYSVYFPDVNGCYTGGATLQEALEMAEDALCLMLYDMEERHCEIPAPSDAKTVWKNAGRNAIVSLVRCDTEYYRKLYKAQEPDGAFVMYPAIFHPEEDGGYSVLVPDMEQIRCTCCTQGDTLEMAWEMASEAIELALSDVDFERYPVPSNAIEFPRSNGDWILPVVSNPIFKHK